MAVNDVSVATNNRSSSNSSIRIAD